MELHDTHDAHAYILVSEMPSTTNDKNEPFYRRSEHTKKHTFFGNAPKVSNGVKHAKMCTQETKCTKCKSDNEERKWETGKSTWANNKKKREPQKRARHNERPVISTPSFSFYLFLSSFLSFGRGIFYHTLSRSSSVSSLTL